MKRLLGILLLLLAITSPAFALPTVAGEYTGGQFGMLETPQYLSPSAPDGQIAMGVAFVSNPHFFDANVLTLASGMYNSSGEFVIDNYELHPSLSIKVDLPDTPTGSFDGFMTFGEDFYNVSGTKHTLSGDILALAFEIGLLDDMDLSGTGNGNGGGNLIGGSGNNAPVPEPSTWILLSSGLAGLAWYGRKRKKA